MISFIRGKVAQKGANFAVVDVGGIGLKLLLPARDAENAKKGEETFFNTYFSVRDYDYLLFTWHRYFSFAYWHDANFIFSRMLLSASGFSSMYLAISAGNSFLPFAAKSKNLSLVSLLACSISIAFN